ncbi:hypothetical protein DRE_06317 [Drechslerella stenobrocha 248]|uniref:Oxidation resistance protein 1 n=1 Tax=Drechslerella stenobrocha 248 TaxID=1043628 RepID=W7HY38_9PEZI|nr:hypothetical protein DRE_06317 [Drechslerella stenobrocha 248]
MPSSPSSRSSSPAPSLVSFLSSSVIRTLQRISSEVTGEDEFRVNQTAAHHHHHPSPPRSHNAGSKTMPPPQRQLSPYLPPALAPLSFAGLPALSASTASRSLLTETVAEEIRLLLPPRLQLHGTWTLMYSLDQHGVSLSTLYSRLGTGAFVFVVKDTSDGVFGAFANESIHPSAGRYYGTGECFLWKASALPPTDNIRFKAFPYSGINDYMILCDHHFISFGGGDGHYGLWVDDNFDTGVSSTCPTFGNEPLSGEGDKFNILGVEVWRVGPPG